MNVGDDVYGGAEKSRLVYPRLLEERSSNGGMVVRVHDDLTLNLRKGSVAARELRVLTEENGRRVTQFYNGEDIEKSLYEDEEKVATVMVTKTGSGVQMEGLVSPSHRIQPARISAKSEDGVIPHEIHEIEHKEMLDKTLTYRRKDAAPRERSSSWSRKGRVPVLVTIEVFVVLDTWHHRFFKSTKHALWYLCVMINSANIRYRAASNPKVKLLLTGVEKAVKEDYVVSPQPGYLFDDGTITEFRKHAVSQKTEYGHPDVVFLATGRNVFTFYQGQMTDAGLGIGYVSGVCTEFYVALGEDNPGLFSGTHTFTHELAHLLGAKHDGDDPDVDMPGHPGAASCSWKLGHIMSYVNKGPTHHQFSTCTLAQISYVLSRAGEACWNIISGGTFVRNVYPGMAVSFQEFCAVLPHDKQNSTFDYVTVNQATCKVRCYFYKMIAHVFADMPPTRMEFHYEAEALDYMPCGDYHVCIQGICKVKPYNMGEPTDQQGTEVVHVSSDVTTTTNEVMTTAEETTTTTKSTRGPTTRMFAWRHRRKNY